MKAIKNYRQMFPEAVRLAVMGYHLEKTTRHTLAVEDFRNFLDQEMDTFKAKVPQFVDAQGSRTGDIQNYSRQLFARIKTKYNAIHKDFQYAAQGALTGFQQSMFKAYLEAELAAFKTESVPSRKHKQSGLVNSKHTSIVSLLVSMPNTHNSTIFSSITPTTSSRTSKKLLMLSMSRSRGI